jgi:hypothetical protein
MLSKPRLAGIAIACAVTLLPSHAIAEPEVLHIVKGAQCTTDGGTDLRLEPGYYLPEPTWVAVDVEMKRLQDVETRLTAENTYMREQGPGWGTLGIVAGALVVGMAAGARWF